MTAFNPYRPGAGTQPPELVGRQPQIDRVDLMAAHARAGRNDGGLFLYGLRGVGKTVLLQRLREIGDRVGWLTVSIGARPGDSGAAFARQRLGFFTARWDRTTPTEQQYLRAIAEIGGNSANTGEVAARLGKKPNAFGPVRDSPIKKGIIFASQQGVVAFTVPNMDSFIHRQPES